MTISTTAPCGAGPNVGQPVQQYTTGQMVQVSFDEVQAHGTFRLALSDDNATFDVVLLDMIASTGAGSSHMVSVQMPAQPCDPCVLQLFQRNGGGGYYSCADVRIVAGAPTTTTSTSTTVPDVGTTTTSTTLPPDPCADLTGIVQGECRVGQALDDVPCEGDTLDARLAAAREATLTKVHRLLEIARDKTKPAAVRRLLKKADRLLAALTRTTTRAAARGRTSTACADEIGGLVRALRALLAALRQAA